MNALMSAARVRPPSENNRTATSGTATVASSAIATSALSPDHWFSCICTSTFNINFSNDGKASASTCTDPAATYFFAANTVYSFELNAENTFFKFRPSADGTFLHWRSSRS